VRGAIPEFTCLLGTLVQETFASHPALQAACGAGIEAHTQTLVPTIEAAQAKYAPGAEWSAESLARHTQAVLQGGFVLAKAMNDPQAALDAIAHLKRYVEALFPTTHRKRR
jgi:TetR/AcrR family transcriptional repressor of nem operon